MDTTYNSNEDWMKLLISKTNQHLQQIHLGGGAKSMAKQKERNKLNARERINYLCDKEKPFVEIGAFAGFDMYEAEGGCPAGGGHADAPRTGADRHWFFGPCCTQKTHAAFEPAV